MSRSKRPQAFRLPETPDEPLTEVDVEDFDPADAQMTQTLELREEQLIAHKDLRDLGEIEVRTEVEDVPGRLEVDAYREEVVVEHEAVGQTVSERDKPWEEDGVLIIPIYEEQLLVTKRLVLRERIRVRRVGTTERQLFQDTLRRERLVVEDPQATGLVRERYPLDESEDDDSSVDEHGEPTGRAGGEEVKGGGFFEHLVRKALE
jgi:uncharacterized protein (TIGR02271 family)